MRPLPYLVVLGLGLSLVLLGPAVEAGAPPPFVMVLGTAQDAGHPQAGCASDCCARAWQEPAAGHRVASLGIVDPLSSERWIIDASPDFPAQLRALDAAQTPAEGATLDGILLTHAHIGHYTGLIHLGREVMGAAGIPIHAMPRMARFLTNNGPWSQLVDLGNIRIQTLEDGVALQLNERIRVTPFIVPHRDEFSETVGFVVRGPERAIAWLPDIDKWERWQRPIEQLIGDVDVAYLDGTFYANGEIPRDMAEIPHPFIEESMSRLKRLKPELRKRVRFIHLNHTNPALDPTSEASRNIAAAGFGVARPGERTQL